MTKAIKFYADWCGPCKMYTKVWDKVSEQLKEEVEFVEVNIDKDTTGLAAKYNVRSIPYTVVIKEDNTKRKVGLLSESALKNLLK